MGLIELFLIAVGLSMDAFAVSVCKGLAMPKCTFKKAAIVGLWFGGFQALMPAIGYVLGAQFQEAIASIDHWIAFVLLALIGGNMIHEALDNDEEEADASLNVKTMFLLAVATSIDALAIGITFAFLKVNIIPAVCFIVPLPKVEFPPDLTRMIPRIPIIRSLDHTSQNIYKSRLCQTCYILLN